MTGQDGHLTHPEHLQHPERLEHLETHEHLAQPPAEARVLSPFGVDGTAEAVYLAMLRHPDAGADELAAHLGLGPAAVRTAFDALARLALLRPSWEDPLTLRPVTPEVGLEALLAQQQAELLSRRHRLEQGRAALAVVVAEQALADTPPAGAGATGVVELTGSDAVRERVEQLTGRARTEVLSFVTAGSPTAVHASSRPLEHALLARGVALRTVVLESVLSEPGAAAHGRWLTEHGARLRTAPTLPLRMVVVDRETAVVPPDPELPRTGGATVLSGRGAVAPLCALFEQVWATATAPAGARARDERGLTGQERALLRLLADGHTDETAARRLGVSDRTVRRLSADLTDRLGARSRFQAGALAAGRGWLG
ncbi:helix-turn-helix transcriptional regulator [Kitasatospora sp. NPDC002227]|uniref:helix-turn-helix transcriptional regulator n=1 Tax=Kitasatospora sp. NPDC002227 TaxID=3154773 RepID=UPI00331E3326